MSKKRYRVIESWKTTYPDPIIVRKGDRVNLTDKRDDWEGHIWIWASTATGKAGWLPDDLLIQRDGAYFANRDFNTIELTCVVGEEFDEIEQTHGWVMVENAQGEIGWVPLRNLHSL